jgi:hypothetical protein
MQFAFDGTRVSSSPFPCRVAVFDAAGTPVIPAATITYPGLVICPMAQAGCSPFRGLFEGRQKLDRDSEGRKFIGAAPSGYCSICKVEYADSQERRISLLHLRKREAVGLWTDLAKRVRLLM